MNEFIKVSLPNCLKTLVVLFKLLYSSNVVNAVKNEVDFALFVENFSLTISKVEDEKKAMDDNIRK